MSVTCCPCRAQETQTQAFTIRDVPPRQGLESWPSCGCDRHQPIPRVQASLRPERAEAEHDDLAHDRVPSSSRHPATRPDHRAVRPRGRRMKREAPVYGELRVTLKLPGFIIVAVRKMIRDANDKRTDGKRWT